MENTTEWKSERLPIGDIIIDENLQIRVGLSEDRVNEFMEVYDQLPSVKIVKDGSKNYLADGFHRFTCAKKRGEKLIDCDVTIGDYKGALEIALKENCKGPLSLTRADKRKAVEKMLMFFTPRANTWIAEDVGVSMQMVESVRTELERKQTIPKLEEFLRRDERTTPRVYPKETPVVTVVNPVNMPQKVAMPPIVAKTSEDVEPALNQSEMQKLSKLFDKKYAGQETPVQQPVANNTLQSVQKALDKDKENVVDNTIKVSAEVKTKFFSDETDAFAEAIGNDDNSGIRIRKIEGGVAINIYGLLKAGGLLFPKAVVNLSLSDFNKVVEACNKYIQEQK